MRGGERERERERERKEREGVYTDRAHNNTNTVYISLLCLQWR